MASPAHPETVTTTGDAGLRRWNSGEWYGVRAATYRTLLDMTVFPVVGSDAVPLPNALRQQAVEHHLIEPASSLPTARLLRLNPGLRAPDAPA